MSPDLPSPPESHQLYSRRWLILAIFCTLSFSNSGQWISFAAINNIVQYYYNVSSMAVNCLSIIFFIVYVAFITPSSWILDRYGLKVNTIMGSCLNTLGAWIKFAGSSSSGFVWVLLGQIVTAVAQCFILGVPARLAAVWFGENERSTATALGVFANQVGIAVYFAAVPLIVPNSENHAKLYWGFSLLHSGIAIICSLVTAAVFIAFQASPPSPPSRSQALHAEKKHKTTFAESLKQLVKDRSYMLLLGTYGIYAGVSYTLATLLNEMVTRKFKGVDVQLIGLLGAMFIVSGLPGMVLCGVCMDKTKAYRLGTMLLVFLTLVGMVTFTLVLEFSHSMIGLFFVTIVVGFFGTSFLPLGFEFAAELTYPVQEGTSSSLLNTSAQFFGIFFIVIVNVIITKVHAWYNVFLGNLFLSIALLVGFILLYFVKPQLLRQEIDMNNRDVHPCSSKYQAISGDSDKEN